MERNVRNEASKGQAPVLFLAKCLLFSYILTGGLLMLLALGLYRLNLSAGVVSAGIIIIYTVSSFLAGFMAGKKIGNRKFLWGLLMGTAYFVVLAIISLLVNHSVKEVASSFATVYVICAGSGMLGGMIG
ncbi:MAG: TIGR04086 family membrane protein [Lachnospiraceae bacterium]|nr:TIGR04086 family membrane protein [Lachnospiraceae bacterium]